MFVKLLRESVLISATIALMLVGVACYLWASGQVVPQELYLLLGTVVGFYFGTKTGQQSERISRL